MELNSLLSVGIIGPLYCKGQVVAFNRQGKAEIINIVDSKAWMVASVP